MSFVRKFKANAHGFEHLLDMATPYAPQGEGIAVVTLAQLQKEITDVSNQIARLQAKTATGEREEKAEKTIKERQAYLSLLKDIESDKNTRRSGFLDTIDFNAELLVTQTELDGLIDIAVNSPASEMSVVSNLPTNTLYAYGELIRLADRSNSNLQAKIISVDEIANRIAQSKFDAQSDFEKIGGKQIDK